MKRPQTIWVRNNGTETFQSRFDGEDFEIPPGKCVEMLAECATLCLGFGEEDKIRCLRRLGWAFSHDAMKAAQKRLDTFSFHMTERQAVEHRHDAKPAAKGRSSAPAVVDAPETSQEESGAATIGGGSNNPLAKLAQALPAAA